MTQPGQQMPQPQESDSVNWKQLFFAAGGIVVALIIVGVVVSGVVSLPGSQASAISGEVPQDMKGAIFMTLAPKNKIEIIEPYIFSFANNALIRLDSETQSSTWRARAIHHSFSKNGAWGAFIGVDREVLESSGNNFAVAQVYRAQMSSDRNISQSLAAATAATDVISAMKRVPSVSNAGEIVYVSRGAGIADEDLEALTDAESWLIYHVRRDGSEEFIDNGIFPRWVNEDEFIYLKNDGLYVYATDTKTSDKIWGSYGTVYSNMMMDVSSDGRFIAWTAPDSGRVFVLEVKDWVTRDMELKGMVNIHGFWPTLSPDGKYLAIQRVNWEAIQTDPMPRLVFYNLESLERVPFEINLDSYWQNAMFVTDWVTAS